MIGSQMFKADKDSLVNIFLQLTKIDSVSFHERKMAALLKTELQELGFEVSEDSIYFPGVN